MVIYTSSYSNEIIPYTRLKEVENGALKIRWARVNAVAHNEVHNFIKEYFDEAHLSLTIVKSKMFCFEDTLFASLTFFLSILGTETK